MIGKICSKPPGTKSAFIKYHRIQLLSCFFQLRLELPAFWTLDTVFYRQLLPFCTHARITYTSRIYPADCSFPTPLPELGWVLEADEPVPDTYGVFRFQEYRNPAPEPF